MKTYQIEDTIIAYFDGRLNDSESAELLHRVSVSPEIRQIFQQHEAIRNIAIRAARNVSVPSAIEESLFARIAALQEEREDLVPVGFWSLRRVSATAGVLAVLLAGVIASLEFRDAGAGITKNAISGSSVIASSQIANRQTVLAPGLGSQSDNIGPIGHIRQQFARVRATANSISVTETPSDATSSASEPNITMLPVPRSSEINRIALPTISHGTLQSLREIAVNDEMSNFEFGVASPMSGFNTARAPQASMFADVVVHAAYNLDSKNQVGVRLTSGQFPGLVVSAPQASPFGFSEVTGAMQLQQGYAGELFYHHREAIEGGLFFVTGGIGGGFYSYGSLFTGELGVEIPFGEKLLGGVSLAVSRLHQNGSEQQMLSADGPAVIYDGPNIFNILAGRIEYGLSYRF